MNPTPNACRHANACNAGYMNNIAFSFLQEGTKASFGMQSVIPDLYYAREIGYFLCVLFALGYQ